MIRRTLATLLMLVPAAGAAAAQAPAPAQAPALAGPQAPSYIADTIYALAVDPADYPEDNAVFLLDDGVVRFEADGRSSRTFRQVVQILRPEAVEAYREFQFSWSPGHERFTVNWIRVVNPDGRVVSAEPTFSQDSDVPAKRGDPVYSDRRVRRASITGVEPGAIVDFSYTTEELKPFLPGDFMQSWSVSTAYPVQRSRFVVDVPSSVELRIRESNLDFPRHTATANGRTVRTWATSSVAKGQVEPFAADSNGVDMSLVVSSPITWEQIGNWYAGHARDRYARTAEIDVALAAVWDGAATRDDSLRAVHRWVAQDIRYVSISLGLGGYQPRAPREVLLTGYGDCKDKATLLIVALRTMGMEAYPVLLNSTGGVVRELPSLGQLNHAIVAVRRDGDWLFIDPTSSLTPLGQLPWAEQGEFGLIVRDGEGVEIVTLPQDPIEANHRQERLSGEIAADGTFTGTYEESVTGSLQYQMRDPFENPIDEPTRAEFAHAVARGIYPTAVGDSAEIFDGKDLAATPRVRIWLSGGPAFRTSGGTKILTLPFGSMEGYVARVAELEEWEQRFGRKRPIDAALVTGDNVLTQELRFVLPEGWSVRVPESRTAHSVFGSYAVEYAQDGRELRMMRRFAGARGVYGPERFAELIEWFGEIGKDDAAFVVIEGE